MAYPTFVLDARYRVLADFVSGWFGFSRGEVLVYKGDAYSPYDNCYFFEFLDQSGRKKSLIVHANVEIDENWDAKFEKAVDR